MTTRARTRIAITGGAAALCLGVAVPAYAGIGADGATTNHDPGRHSDAVTLADAKAHASAMLTRQSKWLTELRSKIAASDKLTAAQRSKYLDAIDKAVGSLSDAKAAVADAATKSAVRKAVRSGWADLPQVPHPDHAAPTLAQLKSWATKRLEHATDSLTALRARVAASDKLTAEQKAKFAAKVDSALDAVSDAKAKLAAADTREEVKDALGRVRALSAPHARPHRAAKADDDTRSVTVASRQEQGRNGYAGKHRDASDADDQGQDDRDGRGCCHHGDRDGDRGGFDGNRDGGWHHHGGGRGDHDGGDRGGHHGGGHNGGFHG